jgi:hypothetical protein
MALSKIFTNILKDKRLYSTYLIINALNKCTIDLSLLLNLIAKKSSAQSRIKWIISSHKWPSIKKGLNKATQKVSLHLELNEKSISTAITTYIQVKVDSLAIDNKYDNNMRDTIQRHLSLNTNGTFL